MSDDGGVTPSQETDHVSPTEVTPELGKGALDIGGLLGRLSGRLDKTGTYADDGSRRRGCGQTGVAGVHTTQRLNLSKPWEGPRMIGQCLEPDPGNLAVRDFRGASGTVRHGETVTPSRNRKSGNGNPSPTAGRARFLSRPKRGVALSTLHHVLDLEWMKEAYRLTRKDGASGIDGVTAADFASNLEANLLDLLERIKSGRYHAPPVRRVYIPKADGSGSRRPLGIP